MIAPAPWRRYRVLDAALPRGFEAARSRRALRRNAWLDFAAHAFLLSSPSPLRGRLPEVARAQRHLELNALTPPTRRQYTKHIRHFLRDMLAVRARGGRIEPRHVELWLAALSQRLTPKRCLSAYTAVRYFLRTRALFDPERDEGVAICLRGLRRQVRWPRPIRIDSRILRALVASCNDSLRGRRDRAAILMLAAGLRPPFGLALRKRDLEFREDGIVAALESERVSIAPGRWPETCPVAALRAVCRDATSDDYVICSLRRGEQGISMTALAQILEQRSELAGFGRETTQSLRRRFLWSLGELGLDDTIYACVAGLKHSEAGRRYNLTRTPRLRAHAHRARHTRALRGLAR